MSTRLLTATCLLAMMISCRKDPTSKPTVEPSPHAAAVAKVARVTEKANQDPLLAPWTGPYGGVPPFDKINTAAFPAAFALGIELEAAEIDAIASNPEPPTFANTLVPLENAGRHLWRVNEVLSLVKFRNLNTADWQVVDSEWMPKVTAATDQITFNAPLFARIAAVYRARGSSGLTAEQQRLVELTHDRYVRAGAMLTAAQKAQVSRINQELESLFLEFGNKLKADENTWVVLDRPADLAGLSDDLRATYRAAADNRTLAGKWAVVNTRSSVEPFLTLSSRRDLREKVWRAFKNRGDNGGPNDTNATIVRMLALRAERATLFGFRSHAHFRMADTMAVDPEKANDLMLRLWPAAVARVGEEVAEMQKIADTEKGKITIEPWDYLYYAERVRKAKYDFDSSQVKLYFELNNMIAATFFMAEKLYGLTFAEITDKVPVFHPDVRVWEVKNKASGTFVGLFYGDYFARSDKDSGAWSADFQSHATFTGKVTTAIASNHNNFVRGAPGQPVLISLDDGRVLFHEFGHALHTLLSEVNYRGLDRTPRDFVEYPSQVHEQWLLSRPILDGFAKHYQTGKPMPQTLVDKIQAASKFNQGYQTVEWVSSGIVDMALHTAPSPVTDIKAFERETLQKIGAPPQVVMRHRLPNFGHLFNSDSYSAGYYSYFWSEVMDADTRQAFVEAGDIFDQATADKLRKYILAPGNSTDRAEAYRQFRGRDPDVKALLEKRGFPIPK